MSSGFYFLKGPVTNLITQLAFKDVGLFKSQKPKKHIWELQPNRPEVDPPQLQKIIFSHSTADQCFTKNSAQINFSETNTDTWMSPFNTKAPNFMSLKSKTSFHMNYSISGAKKGERYTLWILIYWTLGPPPPRSECQILETLCLHCII